MTTSSSSTSSSRPSPTSLMTSSLASTRRPKRKRGAAVQVNVGDGGESPADAIRRALPPERILRALKVKDPTILRYHHCVSEFVLWCRMNNSRIDSPSRIDKAMCMYFMELRNDARPSSDAAYTIFGWILLRGTRSTPERTQLPLAKGSLAGWVSRSPGGTRTGIDPALIHVYANEFMMIGRTDAAVCLEIQLDTYARPSEAIELRGRDFFPPNPRNKTPWGVVFGNSEFDETTKTKQQDDTVLFDSVDRPFAGNIVQRVVKPIIGTDVKLFPHLSLAIYEKLFRQVSAKLKLKRFRITPHTIRHSGPSFDRLKNFRSESQIQERGRWACTRSVMRYRKPGRLLLSMSQLPSAVQKMMKTALKTVISAIG
jgi:integrase